MGFESILEKVGSMGKFQAMHVILLAFPILFMASHNLLQNFVAAVPSHRCRVRPDANATEEEPLGQDLLRAFVPLDQDGRPDKCRMYTVPQWHLLTANGTQGNWSDQPDTQPCADGWVYDRSQFSATIVTEWDLVCNHKSLRDMVQSFYMAGVLAGSIVFGRLSDRYGRRTLLLWSHLQLAVSGTCGAFAPSFPLFCFWRFLAGMALSGIILNTLCLCVEWIPTNIRTAVMTFCGYSYTFGQLLLAGIAYGIRNNRWLNFAVSIPFYVFFLYSWWFPESVRWLMMNNKAELALKHLKRVAMLNSKEEGKELTMAILRSNMEAELTSSKAKYGVLDLFKTPTLRRTAFCTMLVWFATSFSYYALAIDLQGFGVNIYLIQVIFGAVDIPVKLVGIWALSTIGRRFTQGICLILAGVVILINIFIPADLHVLKTTIVAFGKGCLAASFSCCFIHASELYPTVIRQTGVGLVNTMARIGAMVSPVIRLTSDHLPFLPMVIYGSVAVISGASAFCLPETLNIQLPDTIEDVESRGRQGKVQKNDGNLKQGVQIALMEQEI
ncbi:solute carrier family 22 member 6-A-like [Narcine bancroftii]|uniref:solute carrier family 22 member 6-A-like n=1 Tax=Narcine bancroftii TaxID=1343680 RepID=UPI003831EE9C